MANRRMAIYLKFIRQMPIFLSCTGTWIYFATPRRQLSDITNSYFLSTACCTNQDVTNPLLDAGTNPFLRPGRNPVGVGLKRWALLAPLSSPGSFHRGPTTDCYLRRAGTATPIIIIVVVIIIIVIVIIIKHSNTAHLQTSQEQDSENSPHVENFRNSPHLKSFNIWSNFKFLHMQDVEKYKISLQVK